MLPPPGPLDAQRFPSTLCTLSTQPRTNPSTCIVSFSFCQDDEIHVVTDYKPGVATGAATALPTMVIDPITGATVAASDLSDHMRIQLMDPKWREEQARAAAKQKDTALAEGDSIAASLKSLARKRGDIFGSAEVRSVFFFLNFSFGRLVRPSVGLFIRSVRSSGRSVVRFVRSFVRNLRSPLYEAMIDWQSDAGMYVCMHSPSTPLALFVRVLCRDS